MSKIDSTSRLETFSDRKHLSIPKPEKDEERPLGIPVMRDRATQALVKAALEPEWESKFEPNSYGFRSGRSAHDAIEAIFRAIRSKPKYVLYQVRIIN
nr:reverse transcriptase/maturase family protein [Pleurocapsa sp. PCC 7319]